MLSPASSAVVSATLPAVEGALGEISERFYRRLFDAHPELLRNLFNRGNQAAGTQQQALAAALAGFARLLVHRPDSRPDAMLDRIANKHASIGVTAGQYPIVQDHLTAAIGEVLGGAFTAEAAAAWDDVYWLMANALIGIERRLYAQHGVLVGDTWNDWVVTSRTAEAQDVVTLELTPADGLRPPSFQPGQYVSVQVQLADGARQIRQYSLSRAADASDVRYITVKRVRGEGPDGEVSHHLHEHAHAGTTLRLSAPYGDLTIKDTTVPLLLASAGIGCTPLHAMLEHLVARRHRGPVTVLHGDRSPAHHPLRMQQKDLVRRLPHGAAHFWYEDSHGADAGDRTGFVDIAPIALPERTHAYLCGPLPFMKAVRAQLLTRGLSAENVHYEVFGPDMWLGRESEVAV